MAARRPERPDPPELLWNGQQCSAIVLIMNDRHQSGDLRVQDHDGHHVFKNFSIKKLMVS